MWKVLLVDDDREVLEGIKDLIPWFELEMTLVGEAIDGEAGLQITTKHQPDIIITDIYMPVMNGLDMIEQLRREGYEGNIIILSGYSDFEYARQALRLNVNDYLSKPISSEQLINVLKNVTDEMVQEAVEEFQYEEAKRKLQLYEPFVNQQWLKNVVTGLHVVDTANYLFEQKYETAWKQKKHVVLGIQLYKSPRESNLSATDWNLFRFAVSNIIMEIAGGYSSDFNYLELTSYRSILLLCVDQERLDCELKEMLEQISAKVIESVDHYLKLKVFLRWSEIQSDWQLISHSVREAFGNTLSPLGSTSALSRDRLNGSGEYGTTPTVAIKFYQRLAEAVKHGQKGMATQVVNEFLVDPSPEITGYFNQIAMELWTLFGYFLYDAGIRLEEIFPDIDLTEEVEQINGNEDFREWLQHKIDVICSDKQWHTNVKHKQVVDFVIQYVHGHYAEDISLNDLSAKVYLSRNYLSSIFRQSTGENFNSYVTRIRMEKAKTMVLEGKHLIYEIAEKVGYKNISYFNSLFKKYTGFVPSELQGNRTGKSSS